MNDKAISAQKKALNERQRGHHAKAVKRLEQAIDAFPDEIELYLDTVDTCLECGEISRATHFLKIAHERFVKDKERLAQFMREKLATVHDPALARFAVENAVKLRDLESALNLLEGIPEHTTRDLLNRVRTKKQTLKSANHGGYSLRNEMVTNEILAALLSIRIGNIKEAVTALVQILDEKPVEHKMLIPFLATLEVKQPKSGRIRFAHACALLHAGNEVEAVNRFLESARMEPAVAALCVERLQVLQETTKARARVERALAEALLHKGDLDAAAAVLRTYMNEHFELNPEVGREVMLLVRPHCDPSAGVNACTWLALDAAVTVEQSNVALELLRPLHQLGTCSRDLYEWFERIQPRTPLTPDVRLLHATIALGEKHYERAAEILETVYETSVDERPSVIGLLDRHRDEHPAIKSLYRKYAPAQEGALEEPADEGEFQMFENQEFKFAQPEKPAKHAPRPASGAPASRLAQPVPRTPDRAKFVDTRDISFDADENEAREAEDAAPIENPGDEISLESNAGARTAPARRPILARERHIEADALATPVDTPPEPATTTPIRESHVANVAGKLYEAGAAAFFHIDDGTADSAPADTPDAAAAQAGEPEPVPAAEASAPPDFDELYARFRRSELGRAAILALMERAVELGRTDELGELLCFEPADDAEVVARDYFRAQHLVLCGRPLPALEILSRLDQPTLSSDWKERVWLKTAVCQRLVKQFAAANDTLVRLVDEFPAREEYARLARVNYEQYVREQCNETVVLEKTSTID